MSTPLYTNPDQALIHRFMAQPDGSLSFDCNPMALALRTRILSVDAAVGRIELGFDPDTLFIQGTGVLQGGAVTAMMDFAMAFALLAQLPPGQSCATVNLTSAFLRPAPKGRYKAIGELERRGKALAFTQARLLREDDQVQVASATSTLALL